MDKFSRTTVFVLLFCVSVILQFQPVVLEVGGQNVAQNQPENPHLSKILMDTISLLKRSHKSSWEKIKTVARDLQMQFSPPNLEGVGETETELGIGGVKGTIKAVGKSYDRSKEAVDESAKSAAKVVEEAIHKTAEKVKESSSEKESQAEL